MRLRSLVVVATLLTGCKSGCKSSQSDPASSSSKSSQQATKSNAFAFALFDAMRENPGNFVIAPAAIALALGDLHDGAKGDTARPIASALRFEGSTQVPAEFTKVADLWTGGKVDKTQLRIANRLWLDKRVAVTDSFKKSSSGVNKTSLQLVDFAEASDASRQVIDQWAKDQTGGKVPAVVWKSAVDASARMMLTTVAYFNGRWRKSFDPHWTKPAPFMYLPGVDASVPTMAMSGTFPHAVVDIVELVELPCANDDLAMTIVVPKHDQPLGKAEEAVASGKLTSWMAQLAPRQLAVYVPKFSVDGQYGLSKPLAALGIVKAFEQQADFSNMSPNATGLSLAEVAHRAVVEVGEGGDGPTDAGALAGDLPVLPGTPFNANRPFLFVVRDTKSGVVLFIGRFSRP